MRRTVVAAVAAGALALTGCRGGLPRAHQLEKTLVMQTLGVDPGPEPDTVEVSASSEGRPGAGESPGSKAVVLQARGETLSAACGEIRSYGREDVFYGDIEQVLVGEDLAARGLWDLLDYMGRDQALRLEARLWVVRGGRAGEALSAAAEGGGAAGRLHALENDSRLRGRGQPKPARRAYAELLENGCTWLPALEEVPAQEGTGAEGETELVRAGYALLRNGVLAGWADGEAARGLELLLGTGQGELLELTTPGQVRAALEITGVTTRPKAVWEGDRLAGLVLECEVTARAAELRGAADLEDAAKEQMEGELGRMVRSRLEEAMDLCQALGADVTGLGRRAALRAPWDKEKLTEQWAAAFPVLETEWAVTARVERR